MALVIMFIANSSAGPVSLGGPVIFVLFVRVFAAQHRLLVFMGTILRAVPPCTHEKMTIFSGCP